MQTTPYFDRPQNPMKWRSCARWPHAVGIDRDFSSDDHRTKEEAEAVCAALKLNGLAGERCHFPLETWVERINS